MKKQIVSLYIITIFISSLVVSACSGGLEQTVEPIEINDVVVVIDDAEEVTEEVEPTEEISLQIQDFASARDYVAAYLSTQYGIESAGDWMEANITPADAAGAATFRYVSGPLTLVISAEAAAPYPASYTIPEVTYIANGFYWEGTLDSNGEITETKVVPPWSVLNTEQARDAVLAYLVQTYQSSFPGEWVDEGISPAGNGNALGRYSSESWTVLVEFAPAAPLVSSYHVIVENTTVGFRWEGNITGPGAITEISFSQ
jgi:hypothetical protein